MKLRSLLTSAAAVLCLAVTLPASATYFGGYSYNWSYNYSWSYNSGYNKNSWSYDWKYDYKDHKKDKSYYDFWKLKKKHKSDKKNPPKAVPELNGAAAPLGASLALGLLALIAERRRRAAK